MRWAMGRPDVLLDVTSWVTPAISTIAAGIIGMSPVAAPAGIPEPFVGPDPVGAGLSVDTIAQFDGVTLLDSLARLSALGDVDLAAPVPADAVADLLASPPLPSAVADWWLRTPSSERSALASDIPGLVGNLDGVPFAVRDGVNRTFLASTISGIRAQLDGGVGRAMQTELTQRLHMLAAVQTALQVGPSGQRRTLIALDVAGAGRAVIGVGDLVTAEYVTYYVPGMYVGVAEQLVDWTGNAETGLLEQTEWLGRLGLPGDVATVAWIGYHTPSLVNIGSLDLAYEGRDALTASLRGLTAVRDSRGRAAPYLTIVGHSYGSTAAMLALQEDAVVADALVMVGSPGSPVRTVADLQVRGGNVWVAAAATDPVRDSGLFGSQPSAPGFGANLFSVRGTTDPITGDVLGDITGHVYYFWPGTTAVRNTALIAIGHGELATTDGGDGSSMKVARASSR